MAHYFLDSSAAVKYYHAEVGTPAVIAIFAQPGRKVRISSLGFLEIQSAIAMKVRSGFLSKDAAGVQRARLLLDLAAGEIEVFRLTAEHFAIAERLLSKHAFARRLRTLDAIQLSVALDLSSQGLVDHFVVADQSLGAVAALEGLHVINP